MLAKDAKPGFYVTPRGRVIKIVPRSKVSGRWRTEAAAGVPYKALGNPTATRAARQVAVYGWLPPEYEIRPASKPRWWRKQESAPPRRQCDVGEEA